MKIFTETGSIYDIDLYNKIWTRLEHSKKLSPDLRTEFGVFETCNIPIIGGRFEMLCPAYTPGTQGRFISTSLIIKIED